MKTNLRKIARFFSRKLGNSRATKTKMLMLVRGTDKARWSKRENLYRDWDSRTLQIAKLIPPASRVLEFGAGNGALEFGLPEDCEYYPSDIVARTENYLVIDLNGSRKPNLPEHDVVVFSGVLEYVHDVRNTLQWLAKFSPMIIASYATCENKDSSTIAQRRNDGWVNDLSQNDIEEMARSVGYRIDSFSYWPDESADKKQAIFVFARGD